MLDVQARLQALGYPVASVERGFFGGETESAVKVFQIRRGLSPDGIVGELTWRELVEACLRLGSRMLYLRRHPMRGDDVRDLQRRLNALGFDSGKEDGIFGAETHAAVTQFQRGSGLPKDGIVGRATVDALNRLARRIQPGSKSQLRERISRERGGLAGRRIYLDPGHGGPDVGVVTSPGVPESYVVYRVAEAAAEHLERMGARPMMSRAVQQGPDLDRRTLVANEAGTDVAVSFHFACRPESGPWVAFWSMEDSHSRMGRDLAESVGGSLESSFGRSSSILGRNLPFLRQTKMPAVVVDLSCPGAEPLLGEDPYLTGLGEAVASGVSHYFDSSG
ncbi:MAG TPA: peptidoglycan-binding protein [Actinomycetota bacterium]|nr:peptidoglycan-binding protein [Actinomycetota bacterium]